MANELEAVMNQRQTFLNWLAGFIDGEGTISITQRKPQPRYRTYHITMVAFLSIANTHAETMLFIKTMLDNLYGSSIGCFGKYEGKKRIHKDFYLFTIAKQSQLLTILLDLQPFLIMKKTQAELVIKYLESRQSKPRVKHYGSNYDKTEHALRAEVITLNKRGR